VNKTKSPRFAEDRANDIDLTKLVSDLESSGLYGTMEMLESKWAEMRLTTLKAKRELETFRDYQNSLLDIF
jgi:hypothetical protein